MGELIQVEAFDSLSNIALNSAIKLANELNCTEINCSHMMYSLLQNSVMASTFEKQFNATTDEYLEALKFQCSQGYYGIKDENEEVTTENFSKIFDKCLRTLISESCKSVSKVTPKKIFAMMVRFKESEVYETLDALGVTPDKCIVSIEDGEGSQSINEDIFDKMPVTSKYGIDMVKLAKEGNYDPIEGRDKEINEMIEVIERRQRANPCLVGDPGVGKTSIVEGLAQRIADGNVPDALKDKHIIALDMTGIIGGTKFRGDFEEKFNAILNETINNGNIILFFDEFHILVNAGAGDSNSGVNASNILKPLLSKGKIKVIGATTYTEYKKCVEKNSAFERRLQCIKVDEPDIEQSINMLNKVIPTYAEYHNCIIGEDAIKSAITLSDRYITNKKLPDKAIGVIDATAARINVHKTGNDKIKITPQDIKETISKNTGIDITEIDESSRGRVKALESKLNADVVGQPDAIKAVVKSIKRSKAGVRDPNRPIGSFLFVGPTGVGKTELAKAITKELTGNTKNLVRFDMSEFMSKHNVSRLIGSPPGYVGFGEGGQLTEAVRRNPNSTILFDEIEKAHPDVYNILLQILDDGILTDSAGLKVDFKNCIIIMTSNAGNSLEEATKTKSIGFNSCDNDDAKDRTLLALNNTFRPEFLNRIDKVVVFNKLTKADCEKIANLGMKKVESRLKEKDIRIIWDSSIIDYIIDTGYNEKYGARNINRTIQEVIEDAIADKIIDDDIEAGDCIKMSYSDRIEINKVKSRKKVNQTVEEKTCILEGGQ